MKPLTKNQNMMRRVAPTNFYSIHVQLRSLRQCSKIPA